MIRPAVDARRPGVGFRSGIRGRGGVVIVAAVQAALRHPAAFAPGVGLHRNCLRELKKIQRAWPDLHYRTVKGALAAAHPAVAAAPRGRRSRAKIETGARNGSPGEKR